eukprot:COSAG06_NODE_10494_length_1671_cov_1.410941_2_plen_115_part_00
MDGWVADRIDNPSPLGGSARLRLWVSLPARRWADARCARHHGIATCGLFDSHTRTCMLYRYLAQVGAVEDVLGSADGENDDGTGGSSSDRGNDDSGGGDTAAGGSSDADYVSAT